MFLAVAISLIVIGIVSLLIYSRHKHQYWASLGIWSPKATPVFGHILGLYINKYRWEYIDKIYCENKDKKFWGMYLKFTPSIFICDPDIIKLILVKDADSFIDRPIVDVGEKDKYLKEFLTLLTGEKWKSLRSIISPTFSSSKIKGTFPLVVECAELLVQKCSEKMKDDGFVEMKSMLSLYTMDVISSCTFGIKVDCYAHEESQFVKACHGVMNPGIIGLLKGLVYFTSMKLFLALGLSFTNDSMLFLEKSMLATIKARQESGTKRGDFLDLMLDTLKNQQENKETTTGYRYKMSMDTVIASCLLFLFAGYDTTSSALSMSVYLLAKNKECQKKLRSELQKIQDTNGEISYQDLMEAKYLDACFSESLRMLGPAHGAERRCTRKYKVPNHDLTIEKGMLVTIPFWSLQYDPQYWDEPRSFKPERFLPENKHKINQYAQGPFGLGPRNCIGMRFAALKCKMSLAQLVLNFDIRLKPGFELVLTKKFSIIKPDSNGVQVILERLKS